jgi:hypothetical protein
MRMPWESKNIDYMYIARTVHCTVHIQYQSGLKIVFGWIIAEAIKPAIVAKVKCKFRAIVLDSLSSIFAAISQLTPSSVHPLAWYLHWYLAHGGRKRPLHSLSSLEIYSKMSSAAYSPVQRSSPCDTVCVRGGVGFFGVCWRPYNQIHNLHTCLPNPETQAM